MSTNSISTIASVSKTPVSSDRSMPSESATDINHNAWSKATQKRKLTYEIQPIENQSTSSDNSSEEKSSQSTAYEQQMEASQMDSQTPMNEYLRRPIYSQLRWLKLGNVCQSRKKSRQPVVFLDQTTMKYKIRVIDYSSWQWQPMLRLNKLTDGDLKNVDCAVLQSNESLRPHQNPIKFDKDEELIRELSPCTAIKRFQKVRYFKYCAVKFKSTSEKSVFFFLLQQLEEIKKLNEESIQPQMGRSTYQSAKTPKKFTSRPEIEELDKKLRATKPPKGKRGVRKLYNHEEILKKFVQNENTESVKANTKKNFVQNDQQLGKKMPLRLAKKQNFSYT